ALRSASGPKTAVAIELPTKSPAAKKEITVALASGTTSVAQAWTVEWRNAKPPPTRPAATLTPTIRGLIDAAPYPSARQAPPKAISAPDERRPMSGFTAWVAARLAPP